MYAEKMWREFVVAADEGRELERLVVVSMVKDQ